MYTPETCIDYWLVMSDVSDPFHEFVFSNLGFIIFIINQIVMLKNFTRYLFSIADKIFFKYK